MGGKVIKGKGMNNLIVAKSINKQTSIKKMHTPRENKEKSASKNNLIHINEKINVNGSISAVSSFNPPRIGNKKQKIVITAKPANKKELTEIDVLQVVKKNNYDFEDENLINNCITKHFFMQILDIDARKEIVKEMTLCKVDSGETLFKQGSIGNYFYIVKEGEFELIINDKHAKMLSCGDNFGELALLHGAPRSGTVTATKTSLVYCLERRNFRKIIDHINAINYEENINFLNNIPILSNIENDFKSILATQLIKEQYEANKYVVQEGDIGSCMFIIKEGEVECSINGRPVRTLRKGDHFGEKSILLESTRTMDVITKSHCIIYSISVETLRSMAGDKYKDVLYLNFIKMSFQHSKLFTKINMRLLESAYSCFTVHTFKQGETVVKTGYVCSSKLIIIIEGNVVNKKINQIVAKRGDILFENYLSTLSKDKIEFDLVAEPDCLLVEAETTDFIKFLGGTNSFKELLKKSNCLESLYKIPLFKNFTQKKMELLSNLLQVEKYDNGQKIITQGETDSKFYIVNEGKVDIFINSNYIRTLNTFEYFGERALFFKEPRTATAQANGGVELYVLQSKDFKMILEENLSNYLKNRFYLQDNNIELKDLDFVKELGQGNFGSVVLVKHRKNKYEYAIKSMGKKQIDHEQLHANIDLEKSVLLKVDHPFIVKLVKSLKTEKLIFFLMEYIKGKELFDVIRDIGLLNKAQTQFYGASLMLAIDYLHERKYIYRDIKPENVMVCENGYIKIIDFGTVKEIVDRTTTIIGTPHYMSPEVILGEGYSFQVDFWSIAICLYEFICGAVPFGENAEEPMAVYLAIINNELKFPSFVKDKDFISLIRKMLTKSPINRLCKLSQIKSDPWFVGFSWENLLSLNMEPPYIPELCETDRKHQSHVAFVNYLKTIKDWVPTKSISIDKKTQAEYDGWFKNF